MLESLCDLHEDGIHRLPFYVHGSPAQQLDDEGQEEHDDRKKWEAAGSQEAEAILLLLHDIEGSITEYLQSSRRDVKFDSPSIMSRTSSMMLRSLIFLLVA
jgi:hypothetical protein